MIVIQKISIVVIGEKNRKFNHNEVKQCTAEY